MSPDTDVWCNFEDGRFPRSEFTHDPKHGLLHIEGEKPLHNARGHVIDGNSGGLPGLPDMAAEREGDGKDEQ